jgi:hypothetical protein
MRMANGMSERPEPRPAASGCGETDHQMLDGPRSRPSECIQLFRVMRDCLRGFLIQQIPTSCSPRNSHS